jgi:YcaO-like protein with predicted kinase domain
MSGSVTEFVAGSDQEATTWDAASGGLGAPRVSSTTPKAYRGGTHRLVPPAETIERVRRFLPAMGITRAADVTGLDVIGIPVIMVVRPNSRSLSVSQGKGLDRLAAIASGLMESIELYHAELVTHPLLFGSREALRRSYRLAEVGGIPRWRSSLFHDGFPLPWVEGTNLLDGASTWVPYETVHTDFGVPQPAGAGCFASSSNGLASGNHPLEAISHGICEVIERDATTLWSLLDGDAWRATGLDLDTVDDPRCREALERFDDAGVGVAVWETTSDVGVPSFLAMIADRADNPVRLLYSARGMGCHPAREIALLRALTEAAQGRLTYISGARDDMPHSDYARVRSPDTVRLHRETVNARGQRDFHEAPTFTGATFEDDIAWELERLRAVGITETILVDLTKPEFGIPVIRVVIPGLEGPLQELPSMSLGRRAHAVLERRP